MGLWYPNDSGFELTAFLDADHAGCLDTRKSTSGGIQFLGDKLVNWMSKKQKCTAMSSEEARVNLGRMITGNLNPIQYAQSTEVYYQEAQDLKTKTSA
ncbi:hypothetical protein Tco_0128604 [Tanacetum coccineum]